MNYHMYRHVPGNQDGIRRAYATGLRWSRPWDANALWVGSGFYVILPFQTKILHIFWPKQMNMHYVLM